MSKSGSSIASNEVANAGRALAWLGLGKSVLGVKTAAEAINKAGMDWQVRKVCQYIDLNEGRAEALPSFVRVRDRFNIVRDDVALQPGDDGIIEVEALGSGMGQRYEAFQNDEAFDLFDPIVKQGNARYIAAGDLFDGRIVYILAKLKQDLVTGDDRVFPYLLLLSSHDGSTALRMLTVPLRDRGVNTLRVPLPGHDNQWSVRHTANVKERATEAQLAASMSQQYYEEFGRETERLMNQPVAPGLAETLLEQVLPKRRSELFSSKALAVRGLYESSDTLSNFKGTAWGLLNAVSEWETWLSPTQSEAKRLERHARETINGIGMPATKRAYHLLVAAREKGMA